MAVDKISISTNTLNEVLAYLGKRPFEEVFSHVTKLQQEAQAFIAEVEAGAKAEIQTLKVDAEKALGVAVPAPDFPPADTAEHYPV